MLYAISYQDATGQHRDAPLAVIQAWTPRAALHKYFSDERRGVRVDSITFLSPDDEAYRSLQHVSYTYNDKAYDFWMYADHVSDMTKGEL